nr:lysyl oxidase homolog 2 [Manis javanica]
MLISARYEPGTGPGGSGESRFIKQQPLHVRNVSSGGTFVPKERGPARPAGSAAGSRPGRGASAAAAGPGGRSRRVRARSPPGCLTTRNPAGSRVQSPAGGAASASPRGRPGRGPWLAGKISRNACVSPVTGPISPSSQSPGMARREGARLCGRLAVLALLPSVILAQYESWPHYPEYFQQPAPDYSRPRAPSDVAKIQLRLAGPKRKHSEGRVEVYYKGEWGTVCDDDFSIHAAHVVCRELGYVEAKSWTASSSYGKGEGPIWLDNVHCTGKEATLAACSSNGWGVTDCKHSEDVGVVCSDKRIPGFKFDNSLVNHIENLNIQVEDIRVRAILSAYRKRAPVTEGYVEVKDGKTWKQICDKHWTAKNSRVVCGMFGFPGEKTYNTKVYKQTPREGQGGVREGGGRSEAQLPAPGSPPLPADSQLGDLWAEQGHTGPGKGIGPIHLNEIECAGNEKSLIDCKFNAESQGCNHEEDAGVRCNIPAMGFQKKLRLNGGRNPYEGRVEVLVERNGSLVWGTVCGENWGIVEAMVVCRQLGLGFASNAFQETWYWHGNIFTNKVVLSGVKCSGTELSLAHCRHDGEDVACPQGAVQYGAGVACSETAPDLVLNAEIVQQSTYLEDRPMFMLQCAMEENCLSASAAQTNPTTGYRRLLRFSSQIHNNGQSDFRPKNGRHAWIWHDCHRHYHSMEVFTHYDLLNLNGTKVAEGHKASFCLEDTECEGDIQKNYECANFGEQGITMGCWDMYRHDIDCQWVDITDVPPGDYLFQVVINPNYEVAESDYTNNIMKCRTRYDGHRIWMYNCHVGGSFSEETEKKFEHFSGLINNQLSTR